MWSFNRVPLSKCLALCSHFIVGNLCLQQHDLNTFRSVTDILKEHLRINKKHQSTFYFFLMLIHEGLFSSNLWQRMLFFENIYLQARKGDLQLLLHL